MPQVGEVSAYINDCSAPYSATMLITVYHHCCYFHKCYETQPEK